MVEINLFKPGVINASLQLASAWNELHLEELHIYARNQLSDFDVPMAGKAALFYELLAYRAALSKNKLPSNFATLMDPEQASRDGLPLLDFLYTENNLTTQPYPKLKTPNFKLQTLSAPADDFNNLTCGEYEDAEIFFYQFNEEPAAEPLAHMAAILYRPKGTPYIKFNGRTHKYKTYNAEKRVKQFLKLDPWVLYTIFMWYTGCRAQLPKYFPTTFENGSDGKPDFSAFTKCIHSGAGAKNGSRDQIRCTLLKEYFFEMELESIKAKEIRKQYEQHR